MDSTRYKHHLSVALKMTTIIENLHAMRAQIDAMIAAASADGTGSAIVAVASKGKGKVEKVKKQRANSGHSTLHGAWTKHVLQLHGPGPKADHAKEGSAVYQAFMAARIAAAQAGELLYKDKTQARVKSGEKKIGDPMDETEARVGAHIPFVSHYKELKPEEHAAFKLEWEAANPKGSRAASVADDSSEAGSAAESDGTQPKKRGAKAYADMGPEELAAAKAKRAAAKAAKTAAKEAAEAAERQSSVMEPASPVAATRSSAAVGGGGAEAAPAAPAAAAAETDAEEEDTPTDSLIAFTHKKVKYLRYGHRDVNGAPVWDADGDIWMQTTNGGKGAYAGLLKADGSIDSSPEVMENEPDLE